MNSQDDQHIIDLIKKGNIQAYAILVDRYKNMIYNLCVKMIRNNEAAEEAAQDSFLKAYKHLDKFKGDSKFSTWLYKVTYNTCLDALKKSKKEKQVIPVDSFKPNEIRIDDNFIHYLDENEEQQSIQRCIALLPSDESIIITLFYFEEMSLEEISKVIDLKPNHVKVKLHRIRKKLALLLKEQLEPNIIAYYERDRT